MSTTPALDAPMGFVEPAFAGFVTGVQPSRAHDRQQDVALLHGIRDCLAKVDAHGNRVDILEDMPISKVSREMLEDSPGHIGRIRAAIRDKDRTHAFIVDCGCVRGAVKNAAPPRVFYQSESRNGGKQQESWGTHVDGKLIQSSRTSRRANPSPSAVQSW